MISLLFVNPIAFFIIAACLVVAITIHEFAHAYVADKLGDPTPSLQGRLSLDPRAHLDPIGTLLIFIVGFGWGKPVMFDPFNLDNPKRDSMLIALAGPASNITLSIALSIVLHLIPATSLQLIQIVIAETIRFNIMLAIFNLVPVHPLDGGKILVGLLPREMALEAQDILNRYGIIILFLLIMPFNGSSAISQLIGPPIFFLTQLLLP